MIISTRWQIWRVLFIDGQFETIKRSFGKCTQATAQERLTKLAKSEGKTFKASPHHGSGGYYVGDKGDTLELIAWHKGK